MGYANTIWHYFLSKIGNEYGVAALMGNLKAESGLCPYRLQGDFTSGYTTSKDYTARVDSGAIPKDDFVHNGPNGGGYGLAQWTYPARKLGLYNKWKSGGYDSIGSIDLACDWLWHELNVSYPGVLVVLKSATGIREASDKVLHDFESPADQSVSVEESRAALGQAIYDTYSGSTSNNEIVQSAVEWALAIAADDSHGYDQDNRWSPDYDCSSFVIGAFDQAGSPVKTNGASYTGDMVAAFEASGFEKLAYSDNLKYGDVLWRDGHTEIYCGDGQTVGAHINEHGTITGGAVGDQTGNEISVIPNTGNWTYILRLPVSSGGAGSDDYVPVIPEWNGRVHKMSFLLLMLATKR